MYSNIKLVERDYTIMQVISKFRFCLGRHIKELVGFAGQRACDRRLAKLIEAGYIKRKHFIYGVPSLYFVTTKAQNTFNLDFITQNVRIEQIVHDIAVIDTAIYFIKQGTNLKNITSERELKHLDGFGNPRHRPDLIINKDNETYAIEIEIALKGKERLFKNIKDNYLTYDNQVWILGNSIPKLSKLMTEAQNLYGNIEILMLSEVVQELD